MTENRFKVVETGPEQFAISVDELTITVGADGIKASALVKAWDSWAGPKEGFSIQKAGTGSALVSILASKALTKAGPMGSTYRLSDFKYDNTVLYNNIKLALAANRVVLPPGVAMAGTVFKDRP